MVKTSRMLSGECVRAVYCKVGLEDMSTLSVRAAGHTGTVLDTRALRVRGVTTVESVKRNLFGCTDREENRRFVERELARQLEVDSQRWGFDFANERPIPGNHRFAWNLVPASTVPVALRRSPITIATPKQSAPKVTKETKATSPEAKAQKRITDFLKPRKRLTNSGKKSPAAHSHKHECGHGAHIRPPKLARLA